MTYEGFLASKSRRFTGDGFGCAASALPPAMFEWQRKIVAWACRKGRAISPQLKGWGRANIGVWFGGGWHSVC